MPILGISVIGSHAARRFLTLLLSVGLALGVFGHRHTGPDNDCPVCVLVQSGRREIEPNLPNFGVIGTGRGKPELAVFQARVAPRKVALATPIAIFEKPVAIPSQPETTRDAQIGAKKSRAPPTAA